MKVRFAEFSLDTDTRQMFWRSHERHLTPKAFDLLTLLIENQPNAISKTDLHARLWPETFVSEANLSILIAEIRSALRDSARRPRFVRTVHRFGYAFCGRIDRAVDVPAPPRTYWIVWRGREIPLCDGDNIIGRDPTAAVRLDLPSVSRRHARIVVSSEGAFVEDLGSKNGTLLRKERITGVTRLADLDELQVGSVPLTVRMMTGDVSTQTIGDQ